MRKELLLAALIFIAGVCGASLDEQVKSVADITRRSVVAVKAFQTGAGGTMRVWWGTGFVFEPSYVLTSSQIYRDGNSYALYDKAGNTYSACVVGVDEYVGVMVLEAPELNLPPLVLGSVKDIDDKALLIAVGNAPGGKEFLGVGFLEHREAPFRLLPYCYPLQVGFGTVPGMAGAPLVNTQGVVVGIVFATSPLFDKAQTPPQPPSTFAIPADIVKSLLPALKNGRVEHPFLGIFTVQAQEGLKVVGLHPQGPAIKSGVLRGDIIKAVDGEIIESQLDLVRVLFGKRPGDTITLTVVRDESKQDLSIRLAELPSRKLEIAKAFRYSGLRVRKLKPISHLAGRGGMPFVVVDVAPNSPAAKAGIRKGDVIVRWTPDLGHPGAIILVTERDGRVFKRFIIVPQEGPPLK